MGCISDLEETYYKTEAQKQRRCVYVKIIAILLANGADPCYSDSTANVPLQEALEGPDYHAYVIAEILVQHGASVNACSTCRGSAVRRPLLNNAIRDANVERAKWLVMHGADPDAVDEDLRTPLHHTLISGCKELIEFVLSAGADTEMKDKSGSTPIFYAWSVSALKLARTWSVCDGNRQRRFICCRGSWKQILE